MDVFVKLLWAIGVLSLFSILLAVVGILGLVVRWALRVWNGEAPDNTGL
jgi:hypothetical protein